MENLRRLTVNVLQPLRNLIGRKIIITSGYRSRKLNELVGGVNNSHHMQGYAADIYTENLKEAFDFLIKNFKFTQAIYYRKRNFIHVSYMPSDLKNQVLYKD